MALDLESKEAIGARLEIARVALEFKTAAAFAASLDRCITPQKWSNYVKGRDRLPVELALIMRKKFRLSLDWLYGGDASTLPGALMLRVEQVEKELADAPKSGSRPRRPSGRASS